MSAREPGSLPAARPVEEVGSNRARTGGAGADASLTHKASRGFAWFLAQSAGVNLMTLLQLYFLGTLLSEQDWGLFGMVAVVTSLLMTMQASGVNQLLVQRQQEFRRWANAAFWISLTMGLATAFAVAASAPLLAWWYHEPGVIPLTLIVAATAPFGMLSAVPAARANGQLRFRLLAVMSFTTITGTALLSIVFALLEFGALSWVLPRLVIEPAKLVVLWWVTRPPVRRDPQWRRWKYLLGDSFTLLGGGMLELLIQTVELLILGRFHPAAQVGNYQFAFSLSRRPMQVVAGSVVYVLFPALSTLQHDPKRQIAAFLRAAKALAVIGMPICLVLAALAEPGVRLLFQHKWDAAIPILAVLSLGMAVRMVGEPANTLLKARGRFALALWMNLGYLVPFIIAVTLASWLGTPLTVGIVVGIFSSVMGPVFMYVAIRPSGGRMRDVLGVYAGPTLASSAAVFGAWALAQLVPPTLSEPWFYGAQTAIIGIASVILYLPLARWLAADAFGELMDRVRALAKRRAAPVA